MSDFELPLFLRDCGGSWKVIDKIFSNILKTDFVVLDFKQENGVVERYIVRGGGVEAGKTLIVPEGESFDKADTRKWKVNNKDLRFHTMAAMISAPFLVSALSLNESGEGESVVELGLGGAMTHMFLAETKPKLNVVSVDHEEAIVTIATKWFGVSDSVATSVVSDDGIKFIERAKEEGKKFDVVICDTSDGNPYKPAPAMSFLQEDVIENIKAILKPHGAFVMNIAYMDPEARLKPHGKDTDVYKKHFPHCLKIKSSSPLEENEAQICTMKPMEDADFYKNHYVAVRKALGIKEYDNTKIEIVREW